MKNLIYKLLGVAGIVVMSSFAQHDFYTSMTKVDYNEASSTVQFSTKVDVAHLEEAIGDSSSSSTFDGKLKTYLANHFKVKINDAPTAIVFANKKVTGEVMWIYFNIPNVSSVSSIEIDNTLLFDKYDDQQNFVNFNVNGKRDSMISTKGNSSAKKSF